MIPFIYLGFGFAGLVVVVGGGVLLLSEQHRHAEKMAARTGDVAKQTSATAGFDMIPMVLNEMNKIGEEQAKVCKGYNLTDEQVAAITNPVRSRYNQLKMLNDNKAFVMPILNGLPKAITNLISGFMK